ncbi:MAG: T9SS type A sorting domain-containing protein, partial [Flavobacteriales bacterium]
GAVPAISSSTSTTVDFRYTSGTAADVAVSGVNSCGTGSPSKKSVSINTACREREDVKQSEISVSPNPARSIIRIDIRTIKGGESVLRIFDLLGKEVESRKMYTEAGENSLQLDIKGWVEGIYTVRFEDLDGSVLTTRLLVR